MSARKLTDRVVNTFSKLNKFSRLDFTMSKKPNSDTLLTQATPEKLKLRQKVLNYMKTVAFDYKDVALDTWKSMKDKPFKSLGYITSMGFVYLLYRTNPNEYHYENMLVEYSNDLIMCSKSTRSETSEEYLNTIKKMKNFDLLRHKSYILFSLIFRENYNKDCDLYEQQCKQLNRPNKWNVFNVANRFTDFKQSIVDLGLLNNWLFMNKRMQDYDVHDTLKFQQ